MKFSQKNLRIGGVGKSAFFKSAILNFFFQKKKFFLLNSHQNTSKFIGLQGFFEILMIILVSSPKQHLPINMQNSVPLKCFYNLWHILMYIKMYEIFKIHLKSFIG